MRSLVVSLALLFPAAASAQDYSGVWQTDVLGVTNFLSIHVKGNWLIAAALETNSAEWVAYEGEIQDNKASVKSIFSIGGTFDYDVEFTSESQAILTLKSCQASFGYTCSVPNGTQFTASKIF